MGTHITTGHTYNLFSKCLISLYDSAHPPGEEWFIGDIHKTTEPCPFHSSLLLQVQLQGFEAGLLL